MKSAIIGYGSIARTHAQIIKEIGSIVAICDVKFDPDTKTIPECPDATCYTDYKLMLDEVKPDIVHICTPHHLHAEMIIEALGRDVNVLCEKPVCIKYEDIDRILDAEKKSKAKLGVCLQNRYNSVNRYIKEYLKDKKVTGGCGSVNWYRDKAYYDSEEWRGKKAFEGGGVLINQAIHTLDLLQWFCSMPESVMANITNMSLKDVIEVEDTANLFCYGDVDFNFFATIASPKSFPVEISLRADGKWIKVTPNFAVIDKELVTFENCEKYFLKECYGNGHKALISDFYNCVEKDIPFEIDGKEGTKALRIVLSAYESHGEKIKIK
ncbi:MAG: Gfo/Idh/MocA family oxidoreductase [Ruminococcaceae bacterium]|nr:Gfo/Idh/MocA family oxidoreductase [Oscillospiraceae bacterium]